MKICVGWGFMRPVEKDIEREREREQKCEESRREEIRGIVEQVSIHLSHLYYIIYAFFKKTRNTKAYLLRCFLKSCFGRGRGDGFILSTVMEARINPVFNTVALPVTDQHTSYM